MFKAEYKETINKEVAGENLKSLQVEEINGTIAVNFDSQNTIRIQAVKVIRAKTEQEAKAHAVDFKVIVEEKDGSLVVRTQYPVGTHLPYTGRIDYTIIAPIGFEAVVNTTNGMISVGPGATKATAGTTNGNIKVEGVDGDVEIGTTNGKIDIAKVTGKVDAGTTNGAVTVEESGGPVKAETTNGRIVYLVSTPPSGDIDLGCTNGAIAVNVPNNSDLTVNASTVNGYLKVDLPLNITKKSRKAITGVLNKGTYKLRAETTNGSVSIKNGTQNELPETPQRAI